MADRDPQPIGPGEIAEMIGVTRQRVDQLSREVGFPEPWVELKTGRIWRDTDIEAWQAARMAKRAKRGS